ncbi:MAG: winged helix-turn-helix domain-containing protein [Candidatus Woesearchaeota archaeon]
MIQLDKQEREIVKQLIKNPRISDNQISKNTKIPVMSVNRKRKNLENRELITYYTSLKKHHDGIGTFGVRQLYTIKLKAGITKKEYLEKVEGDPSIKVFNFNYISTTYLGEQDGHLAVITIVDAKDDIKLMDEFNGKIISFLKKKLGEDAIQNITTCRINHTVRLHHNYLPHLNMKHGRLKEGWPDELIFVDADSKLDQRLLENYTLDNE